MREEKQNEAHYQPDHLWTNGKVIRQQKSPLYLKKDASHDNNKDIQILKMYISSSFEM